MGLFRSKKMNIYCDGCQKKINDYEFVWIDEHKFCQECAADIKCGVPNVLIEGESSIQGQNNDSGNYEMVVEDIFFVNNKGTVLCGMIKKGAVRQNDTVFVGKKKFKVIGIECTGALVNEAQCGMNIGLLIDCLTPHIFNVGDLVIGDPEKSSVHGGEPIKTVFDEPEKNLEPQKEIKPQMMADSKEETVTSDIAELKKYAYSFLPEKMSSPKDYKDVIQKLSKVIPTINIAVMDFKTQHILETGDLSGLSISILDAAVALEIEKWLGVTNITKIVDGISLLEDNRLLEIWAILDMFFVAAGEKNGKSIADICARVHNIIVSRNIKVPKKEEPVVKAVDEFLDLQRNCYEMVKHNPDSTETRNFKISLGKMLLERDAIWVAYDEDFGNMYPYVGITGRMEVFTREEYAQSAKNYFASCHEGHLSVKKVDKNDINKFFNDMLYMGILYFNLDNGVSTIDMSIEDFCASDGEICLDKQNKSIRSYLMRYQQLLSRYNKISDTTKKSESKGLYQNILSSLLSNGITALANSAVYVLVPGEYTPDISLYSQRALDKLKAKLNEAKITNEKFMVSEGDVIFGTAKGFTKAETVSNPSMGNFLAVFTDKATAQISRHNFNKLDSKLDYNIVAVTFDEVITLSNSCDGIIVDVGAYAHIIDRETLNNITQQVAMQRV